MNRSEEYKRKALRYIEMVMSGERQAGELERLSVERHVRDLGVATEMGWFFDERRPKAVFGFFGLLTHTKGEWMGRELVLEGWQCFIIWVVFGWTRIDGRRRFMYANVEVARKNGKTTFAAGIALFLMFLDGEGGAEIYSAAVDRDQAAICWKVAKAMVENSKHLKRHIEVAARSIWCEKTSGFFQPLSKDSGNKDGLNPHAAICDEMHAWKTDDIYNVIVTGMGARRNPLMFSITTAGSDMNVPYYSMRRHFEDVLRGVKREDQTFAIIYTLNEGDDWKDSGVWVKSNPNYGVSVYSDFLLREFEKAKNKGSTSEVQFKIKNLNIWVDAPDVWIQDELVCACDLGVDDSDLLGEECYGGLDLASHVDINALALYFPRLRAFRFWFWIPESKVLKSEDRVDYREWIKLGYVKTTPGDVIDIDWIVSDLSLVMGWYDVKCLAYDPAKSYHGVIQGLDKEGHGEVLREYPQNIRNMSEPAKTIERDVVGRCVDLGGNPVIRWMFRNVVIYRDANDNIKLDKKRSQDKIDGIVAMANAYGAWMNQGEDDAFVLKEMVRV